MLTSPEERVCLDSRRHGIVLVRPLLQATVLAAAGGFLASRSSLLAGIGAVLTIAGALVGVRAVWRWERTHVVVTTDKLFVVRGTVRRRTAAVRLERVGGVEIEQGLLGRLFGYGTLLAGPLRVDHVPAPRRVYQLVEHLLV
ncbi:MAG: PH domain-containing protein [Gaiellaceae bacterium]